MTEKKISARSKTAYGIVHALANAVTESTDFLEAIHNAICDSKYRGKSKKPHDMLRDIYNAARDDKIDLGQAIWNVAYEQFMDAAIGKAHQTTAKAHQAALRHLGMESPISIQSRLNAARKAIGSGDPLKQIGGEIRQSDRYRGRPLPGAMSCEGSWTLGNIRSAQRIL